MKMRLVLAAAALALVSACGAPTPTSPDAVDAPRHLDGPYIGGGHRGGDTTTVAAPDGDSGTLLQDTTGVSMDGPFIGGGF